LKIDYKLVVGYKVNCCLLSIFKCVFPDNAGNNKANKVAGLPAFQQQVPLFNFFFLQYIRESIPFFLVGLNKMPDERFYF
jgi:hypothetical protein